MENATLSIVESITPATAIRWTVKEFAGISTADLQTLGWKLKTTTKVSILTMPRPLDPDVYLAGLLREGIVATVERPSEWERLRTYLVLYQKYAETWSKVRRFRDEILVPMVGELGNEVEGRNDLLALDIEGWQIGVSKSLVEGNLGNYVQQCILSNVCDNCGSSDRINSQLNCEVCGTGQIPFAQYTYRRSLEDITAPAENSIGDFPKLTTCANIYCDCPDALHRPEDLAQTTGFCQACWLKYISEKNKGG